MNTPSPATQPRRHLRRSWVAAAVAGALLISAGSYATLLQVTSNDTSSGTATVPECQPLSEPLQVQADDPVYDATAGGFVTKGIRISNINTNCQNAQLGLYATAFDINSRVLKTLGPNLIGGESFIHVDFSASGGVRLDEIEGWGFAVHPMGLMAPANLAATAADSTSVNLNWAAPSAPAGYEITDYTVEYSSNAGGSWTAFTHDASATPNLTVTGLTAGQTYQFRVNSINSAGTGESATSSPVTLSVPGEVAGLAASPASSTSVQVSWTAPTAIPGAGITDYVVEYRPVGGGWSTFNDGTGATTSVTVSPLTANTSYEFRVTAVNAVGAGQPKTTDVPTITETTPSEPRLLAGATDASGKVVLTWTVPVDNGGATITDYEVQYSPDNGDDTWTTFSDPVSTETTATVTGLTNGTAYYFRVRAVNSKGTGNASVSQPKVTPAGDPSAPATVTLSPGQDNILVTWTAPASTGGVPIVSYRASTPVAGGNQASCSTTSALSCRITGLALSTAYTVAVTATNAAGHSSTATATTTTADPTAPGAPTSVAGTPGDGSVRVTWNAPASDGGAAITRYNVTSSPAAGTCDTTGALACVVPGLTNGTAYTFTVTATNAANLTGPSAASAEITPATTPGAPTAVTATSPGIAGRIALAWTAPASNGGSVLTDYLIQLSIDDGATWSDIVRDPSTGTTATINDLYDTLDYRFRVLAKNAVGYGPASIPSAPVAPTNDDGAPGPVTAITTRSIDDAVVLNWTAPAYLGASVTKYEIQYKCTRVPGSRQDHCGDSEPFENWSLWYDTSKNAVPKATEAQIGRAGINGGDGKTGELFDGNQYLFRVRAMVGTTRGVWIETTEFAYPQEGCVPNAPTGLEGTANSTTSIGLSWTRDPGGNPDGNPPVGCLGVEIDPRTHYKLQYQSSADNSTWSDWSASTDTTSMDTTYAFTGLTASTWYRFRVQEWPDDDNRSAWSPASAAVQTTATKTIPGHPTNVSGDARDASAIITWTAPAGNGGDTIDQYQVTAYTDPAGTVKASGTNPQPLPIGGTFTGLTNGDDYYFRVEAHNSIGWSVASDLSAAVTPRTKPDPPSKPSANPTAGDGTVDLSWTAPADTGGSAITNYLVEYSSDSGISWSHFGHAATTDTGVVVTGLTTGRDYVFHVAAVNEAGAGDWSPVSDSTTPYSVPTAPTSLVGTPESGLTAEATTTFVHLAWAVPVDSGGSPITGYSVQFSIDDGNNWVTRPVEPVVGTSAQVTGLPVSTVTKLRVRAVTSATRGDSGYEWATTTITTATPPAPAPAPPNPVTGLSAAAGDSLVALSWTAATTTGAAVTGYSVRWSTDGSHWSPNTTAATSLAVTGLTNGTLYHFEVSPTSSSGPGASRTVDATPAAPTKLAPQAVRSLAATPGVLVANLTWTEPATSDSYAPVTGYVVQRSTNENSWTTLATLDASKKAYLASGLKSGTTYYFRVFATSAAGDGAIARSVSAVPIATSNYERVAGSAETWTGGSVLMQAGTSLLSKDTLTDVTVTATGSMATSPVGNGYGVWVRATFANSQISGYCFQVDPGYGNNFILRWWTNGKERGTPWASTRFLTAFPAGFDPNAPHVVSVSVLSGVLTARVDGVTVMTTTLPTQSETVNGITFTPNTGGRYGFRTWYPTLATVKDITVQSY